MSPPCPSGYEEHLDQCVLPIPPHACNVLPTSKLDAAHSAEMVRVDYVDQSGDTCFWMDETEVTVEAYKKWIEQEPVVKAWEPDLCVWKTERSDPIRDMGTCDRPPVARDQDPFGPLKPIRCVDFCDAWAYCHFLDKHLCYDFSFGGTSVPRGYPRQWRLACSNGATTNLPWGDDPRAAECNAGQDEKGCPDGHCGPRVVGEYAECRTNAGVLDMLGNVAEWTHACTPLETGPPVCVVRGGNYHDPLKSCAKEDAAPASARLPDLGFRCCAALTIRERAQIE